MKITKTLLMTVVAMMIATTAVGKTTTKRQTTQAVTWNTLIKQLESEPTSEDAWANKIYQTVSRLGKAKYGNVSGDAMITKVGDGLSKYIGNSRTYNQSTMSMGAGAAIMASYGSFKAIYQWQQLSKSLITYSPGVSKAFEDYKEALSQLESDVLEFLIGYSTALTGGGSMHIISDPCVYESFYKIEADFWKNCHEVMKGNSPAASCTINGNIVNALFNKYKFGDLDPDFCAYFMNKQQYDQAREKVEKSYKDYEAKWQILASALGQEKANEVSRAATCMFKSWLEAELE